MSVKTKTFDCVEMKDRIQAQLLAEYEIRKAEFASYIEFIKARNAKDPWVQKALARLGRRG